MRRFRPFLLMVLMLAAAAALAGPATNSATAPAKSATVPATRPAAPPAKIPTVDEAVAALIAESAISFSEKNEKHIVIARPHPAIVGIGPNQANQALKAMRGKLTGEPLRDVYVRYHLMEIVNRALFEAKEPFTQQLIELAPLIPPDLEIELKPWYAYDPPEVGKRYRFLIDSCAVRVGFPPFHRRVDAPESFQYMDPQQRAKAEAMYAEAQSLKGKFKETESVANHIYNYRQIWMNWVIRQYRGELLYAMVAQGDATALDRITDAVVAAAATDPIRATDLISFLNAAYFNGFFGKYDDATVKRVAQKLRSAGAASEKAARDAALKAQTVKGPKIQGPTMSVGWINGGGRWRQVPESLFTLVFGIENDRIPKPITPDKFLRPAKALPAKKPTTQPIDPKEITLDMINDAIERGMAGLETLRPPDVDLNYCSYLALKLPANYWYSDFTLPGQGALTTWAMLAAGESYQNPWMRRRVDWSLCFDSPNTYDRAMRLLLLSQVRHPKVEPWIKRDAAWLLDTMTEQGNWEARNVGARSKDFGDNANGQYAVLGLFAAEQSGVDIPLNVWQKIDQYWRAAQRPPGAPSDGAWAVTSVASLKKGANLNAFANRVSAPMTAGGILSLYLSEMYLYGPRRVDVGQSLSPDLLRGLAWLDDTFSLSTLDGDQDLYYYMWAIQNVGQATGFRTFHDIDWFREVTAKLLGTQQPNGLWTGPKGPHVSTSFALLYLARARGPLAICKLRFDPNVPLVAPKNPKAADPKRKPEPLSARELAKANAWNNRPNDLYNFTTDVSRMLEVPTSWQIADLDQPLYELIESPVLYLATDKAFRLPAEQVQRLKEYLDAGGTLVCVPEGRNPSAAMNAMKSLAAEVSPGATPIRRAEKENKHPFYTLSGKVKNLLPTIAYENAVRPRVVIVEKDIGRDLQANNPKERDAFALLQNIYLYSTGKATDRPRIVTNLLIQKNARPKYAVTVVRIKTDGEFDPEPLALPQLKAFMADRHDLDLVIGAPVAPEAISGSEKVAFLTVTESTKLTEVQAGSLRRWAEAGGTLWIDVLAGYPKAMKKLDELLLAMKLSDADLPPANGHPFITGESLYRGYDISGSGIYRSFRFEDGEKRPTLQIKQVNNRPAILVVRGDVMCGVAGMNHWNIAGYTPTGARQLVANSLLQFVPPPPKPATRPAATRPATNPATRPTTQPVVRAPATSPATQPTVQEAVR
jgi:hypothetical protein